MSDETIATDEAAIRSMGALTDRRRRALVARLEHVIRTDNGLPIVWFAPAGSKKRGRTDHWVAVSPGAPLECTCGELLYPGPTYEHHALQYIVDHFKVAA